jgi:hypothetical protein
LAHDAVAHSSAINDRDIDGVRQVRILGGRIRAPRRYFLREQVSGTCDWNDDTWFVPSFASFSSLRSKRLERVEL